MAYEQIKQNLEEMILIAQEYNVQIVLVGVPDKSLFSSAAPFYEELADKHDLVFESSIIGQLMRYATKKSDVIHFNEAGYQALAERIHSVLTEHSALE